MIGLWRRPIAIEEPLVDPALGAVGRRLVCVAAS